MLGLLPLVSASAKMPEPEKRPMYARLFDRFSPGSGLSDQDKDAIFRQGLLGLAAGMAQTGGQGIAGAIGNGLQSGLLAMNQGRESLQEQQYRTQALERGYGDPAGLREFEAMTEGLSAEDKAKARRVKLGLEGRASSAGMGFETWTDGNGVPRPARMDPRAGQYEIFYEEEGRWVPLGEAQGHLRAQVGASPGAMPGGLLQTEDGGVMPTVMQGGARFGADIPPEVRAQLLANAEREAMVNLPPRPLAPAGLGRGITKAEEAAQVAAAERAVALGTLEPELALRSQYAIGETAAGADITTQAEAERAREAARVALEAEQAKLQAQRGRGATDAVGLLDEAEKLVPTSTGSLVGAAADKAAAILGKSTQGADDIASLRAISGQLVSKMPRMEGPQSDRDVQMYREMAGDLANPLIPRSQRMAALETIRRLQMKYATPARSAPAAGGTRRRYNPATGRIE